MRRILLVLSLFALCFFGMGHASCRTHVRASSVHTHRHWHGPGCGHYYYHGSWHRSAHRHGCWCHSGPHYRSRGHIHGPDVHLKIRTGR